MIDSPHLKVKIKRIDKSLPLPVYQTAGAVAVDLYSRIDMTIAPKEIIPIPSNIIVETPPGYFFMVASRSSTPAKRGLVKPNGIGIIDQDFCGDQDEIRLLVMNITEQPVEVKKGDRLCQGLFVKIDRFEWNEVDVMPGKNRGGFGSTG